MSFRPKVNVADRISHLLHDNVLVRRYERPAQHGSILLPDAYQTDTTMTLWEVVMASPRADAWAADCGLGSLREGDILTSWRRFPTDTGWDDEQGRALFIISIERNMVHSVQRWS